MMSRKKTIMTYLAFALLLLATPAGAQNAPGGEGEYRYDDATQLWRNTANMAGLTIDSTRNRGYAAFDYRHKAGNLHRMQEGVEANGFAFSTERYQQLGTWLYGYGRFSFDMGRTKDRAWSDVMRTYNSNPYFSGSSIAGRYDRQDIDLTAAVGTKAFGHWRGGLKLDYRVGDLSRLRDPRSRSELLDYRLAPSVAFTMGRHTVGLAGHYRRYKEKIPNITTVQTDATVKYYLMSGMEHADGTAGGAGGFQREWVNHNLGAELSYGYRNGGVESLTGLTIERGSEGVYGQYKYQPGHYYQYRYGFRTQNSIITDRLIHRIDLAATYEQSYADEYRQQLKITSDSATGINSYQYISLMTFKKRFQVNLFNLDFVYRLNFHEARTVTGYVGVKANMKTVRNKYLLNTSEMKYSFVDYALEGGKALMGGRLWIDVSAGLHNSLKHDLILADESGDYAQQVLLADRKYYAANYFKGHTQVMYQFPLTVKKVRSLWYVKAYGDYAHANNHLHASTVGIAVGLFN